MSEKEQLPSAVDDAADVMSQYEKPSYDDPAPVKQYEGPELLHMTHPSLKKVPTEVNVEEEDLKLLKEKLIEAMYFYGGVGLSANQVGIDGKYFVMGSNLVTVKEDEKFEKVFFNHKIINVSKEETSQKEGCLSFPGLWLMVKRPEKVTIQYINSDGEEMVETYEGVSARVILHEYDHMLGVNFTGRVSRLKLERGLKAVSKKIKKHQRRMARIPQA